MLTTNQITCIHCKQPLHICRENDKLLIKPFNSRLTQKISKLTEVARFVRVLAYTLGAYKDGYLYYLDGLNLPERYLNELYISLPLCVWEDNIFVLTLAIYKVITMNIRVLPLNKKYRMLLYDLMKI